MATIECGKIVVWERVNKSGKLCPYSPEISQFLEECRVKKLAKVCLGDVDLSLKLYWVDLEKMVQKSEATGTECAIHRKLYDSLNVLGRGFSWQWHDDHDNWHSYEVDVNDYIDRAFLEGKNSISLTRKFPGYHYEIVFSKMLQINRHSKRKRRIRRFENSVPYPVENTAEVAGAENGALFHPVSVPNALTPEYLCQDIPGTAALESQVKAYVNNVENSCQSYLDSHSSVLSEKNHPSKLAKLDKEKSSPKSTLTALVNGKPWTDSRPPHTPQSKLKPVPGIAPLPKLEPMKRGKRKGVFPSCPDEPANVLEKYTAVLDQSAFSPEETCIICCDSLSQGSSYNGDTTVLKLILCSHLFHKACLEAMCNSSNQDFLQCPTCKKIHGEKCGSQPPGEMIYHVLPYSLPGYPECETIRIIYNIHSGIQGPNDPSPGRRYTARGFPRHCYLPDNEMGRKVLRLLIKAWQRRLIFAIGRSSTTGEENTVTWNEIHHKTEFGCNRKGHGFPDPNYFSNVLAELEAHGIADSNQERVWVPV